MGGHEAIKVPGGDVLLFSGNFTRNSSPEEMENFNTWLGTLPHLLKIVVPGRKDMVFDEVYYDSHWKSHHDEPIAVDRCRRILSNAILLIDESFMVSKELLREIEQQPSVDVQQVTVKHKDGIHIYGTPHFRSPYVNRAPFGLVEGSERAKNLWNRIPTDVDIILSYGSAKGYGDMLWYGVKRGSLEYANRIDQIKPKFVVHGQVAEDYGVMHNGHTTIINSCSMDIRGNPSHKPIVFDMDPTSISHNQRSQLPSRRTPNGPSTSAPARGVPYQERKEMLIQQARERQLHKLATVSP